MTNQPTTNEVSKKRKANAFQPVAVGDDRKRRKLPKAHQPNQKKDINKENEPAHDNQLAAKNVTGPDWVSGFFDGDVVMSGTVVHLSFVRDSFLLALRARGRSDAARGNQPTRSCTKLDI